MITWMIKSLGMLLETTFKIMTMGISLFLTFTLNTFTMPLFLVSFLFCKIFRLRAPRFGGYGLMLFPTWSNKPGSSMIAEMNAEWNREQAKIKKPIPIRAYEEWFIY